MYSLPGMLCHGQFDLMKRWLATMRKTFATMVIQIFVSILHLSLCYYFVFVLKMEINGLGLAISLTNLLKFLLTLGYIMYNKQTARVLARPSLKSLTTGWKEYLKLSLPVILILGSEWWAYELITVLAGLINTEAQAAQTLISICVSVFFEVPLGTSEASCALIGNCIGANNVPLAKKFLRVTSLVAFFVVTSLAFVIFLARDQISALCATDNEVR